MAFNPTYRDINEVWERVSPFLGRDFYMEHVDWESLLFYNAEAIATNKWDVYDKLHDLLDDVTEPNNERDIRRWVAEWDPWQSPNFLPPRCSEEDDKKRLSMKKLSKLARKNISIVS